MRLRAHQAAAAACLFVAATIAGCDGGQTRPPSVQARVVHAAPARATIDFKREERSEATLEFRQASSRMSFDADQYDFNIDIERAGGGSSRLASFSAELVPDNEYLIVLAEGSGAFLPIVVEEPTFDGTDSRVNVVHAAPSIQPISVYLEPEGTDPASGAPLGAVSYGDVLEPATRAPGQYELILTERDAPANVLMRSRTITLEEGGDYTFVAIDPAGDGVAPYSVVAVGAGSALLFDDGIQASLQAVNAAADTNPRDIYVDDDFTAPLLAGLEYATPSGDVEIAFGNRKTSVTPAGNTGTVEAEREFTFSRGQFHMQLIAGEPGDLDVAASLDDRRVIADRARFRVMNGASQFSPLELYVAPPDTPIDEQAPLATVNAPGISQRIDLVPDEYELTARDPDTETIVAGPVPITLGEGLYTVLTLNGSDPGTVELRLLEDFQ